MSCTDRSWKWIPHFICSLSKHICKSGPVCGKRIINWTNGIYREINRKLALGLATAEEAKRLSAEGKAIVWIDSGLHATEVAPVQQAPVFHSFTVGTADTINPVVVVTNLAVGALPYLRVYSIANATANTGYMVVQATDLTQFTEIAASTAVQLTVTTGSAGAANATIDVFGYTT